MRRYPTGSSIRNDIVFISRADKRTGMLEQIFSMPFSRFEYQLSNLLAMILVTFGGALIMILVAIPFISLKITLFGFLLFHVPE